MDNKNGSSPKEVSPFNSGICLREASSVLACSNNGWYEHCT